MNHLPLFKTLQRHAHAGPFAAQPPEVWDYYIDDDRPIAAVAAHALLVHATDLRPILSETRQPVLLACGDCDALVGRPCEDVLLRGLPSAGRVEIGGCGHMPYLTHPEALAEVVRRFLTPPAPCAATDDGAACGQHSAVV
jgi:pimeloyl-ACP methyl ester carboxylesterase